MTSYARGRTIGPLAASAVLAFAATIAGAQSDAPVETAVFDFRVEQRSRYETLNDQYRPLLSGSDQALALQTSFFVEARHDRLRFLGEVFDARHQLNDIGSQINATMVDTAEPMQALVSLSFADSFQQGSAASLTVGRFTMDVGRRRLAARSGFRNSLTSFTGFDWNWRGEDGRNLRVFHVVPMRILPFSRAELLDNDQEIDRGNRDTWFSGVFYLLPAFASRDRLELYWYGIDQAARPQNDALPRDFDSLGFRAFRPSEPGRWSYEVEAVLQSGESSATASGAIRRNLDHDAYFYHWEFGYAFDVPWRPVLLLQYDYATGDVDPFDGQNEGYDSLYGERRFDFAPQGIYGPFTRSNLVTPGLRLTFRPKPRWQAMVSYRSYELEQARDTWVGVGWRDLTGAAGKSIGTQLEGSFTWTAIEDWLTVETGFAELRAGRFMRTTIGPDFRGDPTYYYLTLTTEF